MTKINLKVITKKTSEEVEELVRPILKGNKGDTGQNGKNGEKGDIGPKGDKGETGPRGESGKDGVSPKIEDIFIEYKQVKDAPKVEEIIRHVTQASKTTSLGELDDVDISGLTKVNGKYVLTTGGGGSSAVDSVNGQTGAVILNTGDINDTTDKRYVTDSDLVILSNTYNINTGDQLMYGTIAVDGQDDLDPSGTGDTLTFVAGANVTLETNALTNELTINANNSGNIDGGGASAVYGGTSPIDGGVSNSF